MMLMLPPVTVRHVPVGSEDIEGFDGMIDSHSWAPGFVEVPTPRYQLVCQIVPIDSRLVRTIHMDTMKELQQENPKVYPLHRDFVIAIFWVLIIRARWCSTQFDAEDEARLNISVTSAYQINEPRGSNREHFGNSTVTTVALLAGTEVGLMAANEDDQDIRDACFEDYAYAALVIRDAIQKITRKYVCNLTTMKERMTAVDDRHASYKASTNRSCTINVEDWTELGRGLNLSIPYTEHGQPRIVPSPWHMQEGSIILLPRKTDDWSREKWNVCVCLRYEDMLELVNQLEMGGIIKDTSDLAYV